MVLLCITLCSHLWPNVVLHCATFTLLQLLHSVVDSVEKRLSGSGGTLTLKCKDFVHLYLDLPSAEDCLNVAASVEQLSNIGKGLDWHLVRDLPGTW